MTGLDGVRKLLFLLDLSSLPVKGPLADWLRNGRPIWNLRFDGNPAKSFDALVLFDSDSSFHLLK